MKPQLARLLKAASALSGLTLRNLAVQTGISYSRLARIQSGGPPEGDEVERILSASGFNGPLLTKLVAQPVGKHGIPPDKLLQLLLVLEEPQRSLVCIPTEAATLSCDRLSITFNVEKEAKPDFRELARRGVADVSNLYKRSFQYCNVRVEYFPKKAKQKIRWARLDFNPNKTSRRGWLFITEALELADIG
jgi:transcriptional regulator with XRE-family HTH domain